MRWRRMQEAIFFFKKAHDKNKNMTFFNSGINIGILIPILQYAPG
jgi:hypothetical protein